MNDGIENDGNRISAKGNVSRSDLRSLCSALHKTIKGQGRSDVILDFSVRQSYRNRDAAAYAYHCGLPEKES